MTSFLSFMNVCKDLAHLSPRFVSMICRFPEKMGKTIHPSLLVCCFEKTATCRLRLHTLGCRNYATVSQKIAVIRSFMFFSTGDMGFQQSNVQLLYFVVYCTTFTIVQLLLTTYFEFGSSSIRCLTLTTSCCHLHKS